MNGVSNTPSDTGGEARTDYDAVEVEVAGEVLKHAQAMVAAQHTSLAAVDSKLTAVLSQSVTLSLAALGAVSLSFAEKAWMPHWGGIGLLVAGLCTGTAAVIASRGLTTRKWVAPGIPPKGNNDPTVLLAQPSTAMMFMAWGYQKGIDSNTATAKGPTKALRWALAFLAAAPVAGALAAAASAAANVDWMRFAAFLKAAG